MVLAAGRGERMRPLTDTCPKPLLPVRGKLLMQWTLQAMAAGGCQSVVVNTGWLGEEIEQQIGLKPLLDERYQLSIAYSSESREAGGALETLGGIVRALPLLDEVFWLAAGDVFAPDFCFDESVRARFAASDALAHLWLVPNPPQHPEGDFGMDAAGRAISPAPGDTSPRFTYSTIGLYRAALFTPPYCNIAAANPEGIAAPLAPLLRTAMADGRVTAELYRGAWTDVGTPKRLAALNA
jgi:MurNAc alpha-1-phosphate uridylyltransferase